MERVDGVVAPDGELPNVGEWRAHRKDAIHKLEAASQALQLLKPCFSL